MTSIKSVVKALDEADLKKWNKKDMKNSAIYDFVGRGHNKSKMSTEQLREFLKSIKSKKRLCEVASVKKLKESKEFKENKHLLKDSKINANKMEERKVVCKIILGKSAGVHKKVAEKKKKGEKKFTHAKDSLKKIKKEVGKKRKVKSLKDLEKQKFKSSSAKRRKAEGSIGY